MLVRDKTHPFTADALALALGLPGGSAAVARCVLARHLRRKPQHLLQHPVPQLRVNIEAFGPVERPWQRSGFSMANPVAASSMTNSRH